MNDWRGARRDCDQSVAHVGGHGLWQIESNVTIILERCHAQCGRCQDGEISIFIQTIGLRGKVDIAGGCCWIDDVELIIIDQDVVGGGGSSQPRMNCISIGQIDGRQAKLVISWCRSNKLILWNESMSTQWYGCQCWGRCHCR